MSALELNEREERNKLRSVVIKAENNKLISKEEVGLVVMLVERFRAEAEKKMRQLYTLQGEVAQLRTNEQIVTNMIESIISAAERDVARQETFSQIKETREVEALAKEAASSPEQVDENQQ
jgi:hypothetical protein